MRNAYKVLVGKPVVGVCRWQNNIKMDLKGIEYESLK
jgi:hypothetical protein